MAKYCTECGTLLKDKLLEDEGMIPFCEKCNQFRFPNYNVAVSMIVRDYNTDDILLIKQYGRPHFILVAGYVNLGEALEAAVAREIKEETNLDVVNIKFNRTKFFEPSNTLMCNFTAYINDKNLIKPNKEIDDYSWFNEADARSNIRPNSLAEEFLIKYLDEKNPKQSLA